MAKYFTKAEILKLGLDFDFVFTPRGWFLEHRENGERMNVSEKIKKVTVKSGKKYIFDKLSNKNYINLIPRTGLRYRTSEYGKFYLEKVINQRRFLFELLLGSFGLITMLFSIFL